MAVIGGGCGDLSAQSGCLLFLGLNPSRLMDIAMTGPRRLIGFTRQWISGALVLNLFARISPFRRRCCG